jgi:hypothetical protein
MKIHFVLILFASLSWTTSAAQSERFKAGVFGGINLAQADGDRQQGYDRLAYAIGLRGGIIFNRRFDIGTELIYNGKGAKPSTEDLSRVKTAALFMKTHYADVMLTANWNYFLVEQGYFRSTFSVGLSYGRLLRSQSEIFVNQRIDTVLTSKVNQDQLKSGDFSLMVGWAYRFSPRLGVAIRHTASLNKFYVNPNIEALQSSRNRSLEFLSLQSYYLSAHVFYDFITPKLKKKKKAATKTST